MLNLICPACKNGDESVVHVFFHYNFARATWFSSVLQIKSQDFSDSVTEIITSMGDALLRDHWGLFVGGIMELVKGIK